MDWALDKIQGHFKAYTEKRGVIETRYGPSYGVSQIRKTAYNTRRKQSKPKGRLSNPLAAITKDKLAITWSPEQIASAVTVGIVSFKTIYSWLYAGKLKGAHLSLLRQKGRRRNAEKRGKSSMGMSISKCPQEVENRKTFGRWELDIMVSSRGESKGCFATFIERKSHLYTAIKLPDRSIHSMGSAISYLHGLLSMGAFKTGTTD